MRAACYAINLLHIERGGSLQGVSFLYSDEIWTEENRGASMCLSPAEDTAKANEVARGNEASERVGGGRRRKSHANATQCILE